MLPVTEDILQRFVQELDARAVREGWSCSHSPYKHSYSIGRRYARIVKDGSAFCFIDLQNGNILKPESWKKPAPQKRGTIHTPTFGLEYLTAYGAQYFYR